MLFNRLISTVSFAVVAASFLVNPVAGQQFESNSLMPADVFELEYASDPQISPDGTKIVYVRNSMDIMSDRRRTSLWIINYDGTDNRPLAAGEANYSSPRWSPDGSRLLYVANTAGSNQLYLRWMDTGQTAKLTNLQRSPRGFVWSPDGSLIAFSMMVPAATSPMVQMPPKPEGANWASPAIVIENLEYRADGAGFLEQGFSQLFVLPAEGGTPRQVTSGSYNHDGAPAWTTDGDGLVFSANREDDWEYDPVNSEVYLVALDDGSITKLTSRTGPDGNPTVSPDGRRIAYTGFDDRYQGYQVNHLYVMDSDGSNVRMLTDDLDRSVQRPIWNANSRGVFFQYSDRGNTKIGYASLDGELSIVAADVGGLSLGRPYSGGSFSVADNGRFAFTHSRPDHPADIAVGRIGSDDVHRLTTLNEDLFGHKQLASVEEIWYESSFDGRSIQGWIAKPPNFDPNRKYPLILEIHGGPFSNYGDRFATEIQLYAAAGYVVLYTNPRGSSSYGAEFGNLIHHNYPGEDYDDLMSGVDALVERGYIDENNLFVTGGSGGGVLSSWIVGKTDRFAAAVVAKPVINWYSWSLTADGYNFYYKYWFPGFPWDHQEHYMSRSPISLVGNVTTPTMLLTGEEDFRTPMSESEQYYQALQLRRVESALVRIPGASHGIAARPSNLISKVLHILQWFERYRTDGSTTD